MFSILAISLRRFSTNKMSEKVVKIGDLNVNYLRCGEDKKTLFCLPGALGTIWSDFSPQIEGLSDRFEIVVWDPPGYGKSRPPPRDFSDHFFNRDAITALRLLKELKIENYSILGWSDGAITGMIMAAMERVENLVIWGGNAYVSKTDVKLYEAIRDVSKWSEKMRAPLEKEYGDDLQRMWSDWCDAMSNFPKGEIITRERLASIKSRTLILHGDLDPLVPKEHPEYLLDHLPSPLYHSFPKGKHNIHLRYSQEFNRIVTDFINSGP